MINNQLLDYVRQQLALKVSKDVIFSNLKGAGWDEADLNEAFTAIAPPAVNTAPAPVASVAPVMSAPASAPVAEPIPLLIPPELAQRIIQPKADFSNMAQTKTAQSFISPDISPKPTHKLRKIFYFVLVLILLGAAGAGAYAYYTGVFVSFPSLVSASFDSARAANSATYDTTISVDFSEVKDYTTSLSQVFGSLPSSNLIITTKGSYDFSDPNSKKGSAIISADLGTISLGAEIRVINDTFYGVLTKAPTISFFPVLSSYVDKWVSIPYKSADGKPLNNPLTSVTATSTNITDKLTADQQEHIYQMTKDASFVKIIKRFSPETIVIHCRSF